MRYISLFSGIEAASVAWEPLGWEPLAFCEIDEFPSAVLAHRFPDVENLGDITKVDWKEVLREHGPVDVVVGGSPCQSFSVAGKREGLAGASGLMFEYIRAVSEIMPRYWVWENVPGALSSSGGADFGCFLREMAGIRGAGGERYGIGWRVLDAQFFGVAQRRRRLFAVGVLGDLGGPAEILFESEGLRWDTPSSQEKRKALAADARSGLAGSDGGAGDVGVMTDTQPHGSVSDGDGVVGALSATMHKDPPVVIDRAAFNQGGAALYAPHIERTDVMDTIVARGPHAVGYSQATARSTSGPSAPETSRASGASTSTTGR